LPFNHPFVPKHSIGIWYVPHLFSKFSKLRSTIQKQTLLKVLMRIFCKKFVHYLFSMFSILRLTIQKKKVMYSSPTYKVKGFSLQKCVHSDFKVVSKTHGKNGTLRKNGLMGSQA
jgi:hypothetical protein